MKKLLIIIGVLVFQTSIFAQETIDVSLQLNKTIYNTRNSDGIGKKLSTPTEISKKQGHKITSKTNNSEIIWQLYVYIDGAEAVVPYFDELVIPDGAKIRAYSPISGKSTKFFYQNENKSNAFALPLIKGEKAIIEAVFPNQEAYDKFQLNISELGALYSLAGFGDASTCFANVHCSEGTPWQNQIRSVAKYMTVSGTDIGYCSGSLINNTNQDCKNYFLSAQHCGISSTNAEFGQFVFYFNYEASSCTSPSNDNGLDQQTVVGCTKVASSGTSTSLPPDGSDFLLMELNTIPTDYNVYYSGWNRADVAQIQGNGAIIQHPKGDLKKISFWSTVDVSINSQSHIEVMGVASANGEGTVEPSSSGSPIFDGNKNVIGNVTSGSEGCISNFPTNIAFVVGGRFLSHWDQNGATSNLQLKPWLDPTNSGVMSLNGKQQCGSVGIFEENSNHTNISIFPNPASQTITIDTDITITKVNIYSIEGKLLLTTIQSKNIDISKLPTGFVIIGTYFKNGEIAHNKVYKQ